jgi:hypothetical protein
MSVKELFPIIADQFVKPFKKICGADVVHVVYKKSANN